MTKVRIVGGGLTGIVAALQAEGLGCRDIEIHERASQIGGASRPQVAHGLELRHEPLSFGSRRDKVRALLEWRGQAFDDIEARQGSVSPGPRGERIATHGITGPAFADSSLALIAPTGPSLIDRLRAYPDAVAAPLQAYCQWRLGVWLDEVDARAAAPLDIDRVYPLSAEETDLSGSPQAEFYVTRPPTTQSATPREGLSGLFKACDRTLAELGVRVHTDSLVSPQQMLADENAIVVWTAPPAPLFRLIGDPGPRPLGRSLTSYIFKARYGGDLPLDLHNYVADGVVSRLHLYESGGEMLMAAQCVGEASDRDLRREIHHLMAGFGGETLSLGPQISVSVRDARTEISLEGQSRLALLRAALERRMGDRFVAPDWTPCRPHKRFETMLAGLATALGGAGRRSDLAA